MVAVVALVALVALVTQQPGALELMRALRDGEPHLEADQIQGNVAPGFRGPFQRLIGLRMRTGATASARSWLSRRAGEVTTMRELAEVRAKRASVPGVQLNLCLSFHALDLLGLPDTDKVADAWFKRGMWAVAPTLRDPPAPTSGYYMGRDEASTPHVLASLAAEDEAALEKHCVAFLKDAGSCDLEVLYDELGARLEGKKEHFGFRDGVSNPAIRGRLDNNGPLYPSHFDAGSALAERFARPGQPLVWPGQLIFGYPGQPEADSPAAGPVVAGGPAWLANGSLLVFRRLRQDVGAFNLAIERAAHELGIDVPTLKAMVVGRWPNGNPLVRHTKGRGRVDRLADEHFAYRSSVDDVSVLDRKGRRHEIRGAEGDLDGERCPVFAHIRQANPRDAPTDIGDWPAALALQIFRRGIPFTGTDERGLLFLAYATGIEDRFGVLSRWMNHDDAPEPGRPGQDLVAGNGEYRTLRLRRNGTDKTIRMPGRWVEPTGGGFFLSPSVSLLEQL